MKRLAVAVLNLMQRAFVGSDRPLLDQHLGILIILAQRSDGQYTAILQNGCHQRLVTEIATPTPAEAIAQAKQLIQRGMTHAQNQTSSIR